MIKDIHPIHNSGITFNPDNHTYLDDNGIDYISVTTLISNYFPVFESEKIAAKCAIKRGTTKEALLKEWDDIKNQAAENGHKVHEHIHAKLTNKYPIPPVDKYYEKSIDSIISSIRKKGLELVFSERILFSPKLKIAGTVDSVFYKADTNEYFIFDWKTNKTIDEKNDYGEKGLTPINHLDHCTLVHYSLQVLLYKHLLISEGYLKHDISMQCKIINIQPFSGFKKSKTYDALDLMKEVNLLINEIR